MIGRAEGCDIVQLGKWPDGQLMRWSFRKIAPNSFFWRGELSADDGATGVSLPNSLPAGEKRDISHRSARRLFPSLPTCVRTAPRPRRRTHEESKHDGS